MADEARTVATAAGTAGGQALGGPVGGMVGGVAGSLFGSLLGGLKTTYHPDPEDVRNKFGQNPHAFASPLNRDVENRFRASYWDRGAENAEGVLGRQGQLQNQWQRHLDALRQRATGVRSLTKEKADAERRRLEGAMLAQSGGGQYNPGQARQAFHGSAGIQQQMAAPLAASMAQERAAAQTAQLQSEGQYGGYFQGMQGSELGLEELMRRRMMGQKELEFGNMGLGMGETMSQINNAVRTNDITVGRNA